MSVHEWTKACGAVLAEAVTLPMRAVFSLRERGWSGPGGGRRGSDLHGCLGRGAVCF